MHASANGVVLWGSGVDVATTATRMRGCPVHDGIARLCTLHVARPPPSRIHPTRTPSTRPTEKTRTTCFSNGLGSFGSSNAGSSGPSPPGRPAAPSGHLARQLGQDLVRREVVAVLARDRVRDKGHRTKNVPAVAPGTMSCHQCSASWMTVMQPLPTMASWMRTQKNASIAMRPFQTSAFSEKPQGSFQHSCSSGTCACPARRSRCRPGARWERARASSRCFCCAAHASRAPGARRPSRRGARALLECDSGPFCVA